MTVTNIRDPLSFADTLTGGQPSLRVPLTFTDTLTDGHPNVRASYVFAEPLTGGNPSVRVSLMWVEALIPIPPELPVATKVFPTLAGRTWGTKKNPEFNTAAPSNPTGREVRNSFRTWPIWKFELSYEYLRDDELANGYLASDLRTLIGFFKARRGMYEAWLFRDRDDYHIVGGSLGVGDGVTVQVPFARVFTPDEPDDLEPVGQVDLSALATFASTAVNTSTDAINVPLHGLVNGQGPVFVANIGGSLPSPLAASTPYWVIYVDADHFKLATTAPNALAGTAIDITAAGSGSDTLTKGWAAYGTVAETHTVPAPSGPYTVTVTNAAGFVADGGVTIGGTALTKVATSPASGQYSVNTATGVYTFNSAQASASASIAYTWIYAATLTLPNQLVYGAAPASGVALNADFDFWYVCRFSDDITDQSEFSSKLHELQKLAFQSVIQ